jgi:small subunit ribosomal protein S7e
MSYQNKILRTANAPQTPPSEIEQQIAQALLDQKVSVVERETIQGGRTRRLKGAVQRAR